MLGNRLYNCHLERSEENLREIEREGECREDNLTEQSLVPNLRHYLA